MRGFFVFAGGEGAMRDLNPAVRLVKVPVTDLAAALRFYATCSG